MFGFFRLGVVVPVIKVANPNYNADKIIALIKEAESCDVLVFPELPVTGATCAALFYQKQLIINAEKALKKILHETSESTVFAFLSMPLLIQNSLFSCRILIKGGKIISIVPKSDLSDEEKKYFSDEYINLDFEFLGEKIEIDSSALFEINNFSFGFDERNDVQIIMDAKKADVFSLDRNLENLKALSRLNDSTIVYVSSGFGESTTDGVYAGQAFIVQSGNIIKYAQEDFWINDKFSFADVDLELQKHKTFVNARILKTISKSNTLTPTPKINPFLPDNNLDKYCENILKIQTLSLAKRMLHINCKSLLIGVSGGLDSTIALLICAFAKKKLNQDLKEIYGITMPGFGTSSKTYNNAVKLMEILGVSSKEISIIDSCEQHFKDIEHENHNFDVVFENAQARERTQILFDMANKLNGIVVGTGDFTESALGFATFNGDHISNYNVNANIPKTVIKVVIDHICKQKYFPDEANVILQDIVNTHISPELLPASENGEIKQKSEEIVGPYELNDFYLYYIVKHGFSAEKILYLAKNAFGDKYSEEFLQKILNSFYKRFISNQFKRNCQSDGPSIFDFSLSPKYLNIPSDADMRIE